MTRSTFGVPAQDRYFEDYVPGTSHEFGHVTVTEEEIVEFGRRYDPQTFHTDPQGAKQTMYGGLIASGWLTAALMMRLYVLNYLSDASSLGSPGVDELRWLKPVRPGDSLSVRVTIREATRSRSKPDRGIVHAFVEVLNQDREVVMTMRGMNLFLCRDQAG